MSNILDSAKQYLSNTENLKLAHLVSLELPGEEGVFVYFTDYFRSITFKGQKYETGVVKRIGDVKQTKDFTIYRVPVQVSGAIEEEINRVLNSKSFLNRKIKILRVFLDDDGEVIPIYSNGDTITYFEGIIVTSKLDETNTNSGTGRSTITWNCANKNYELDAVNGRITDDESHRGLINVGGTMQPSGSAKKPEYQLDRGFFHAGKSVKLLAEYQTKEKRFRLKKRRAGGFRGLMGQKHYDMEEYWADVVREVDMDINLTAKYLPVLYGVQKVSGIPIFFDTDIGNPEEVWAVYAFCEGEIDGFLDIFFGDNPMICVSENDQEKRACVGMKRNNGDTIGALAPKSGRTAPSKHGEHYIYNDGDGPIEFWTFHGSSTQDAAKILVDKAAASEFKLQSDGNYGSEYWDDTFKLLDTAYVVVKYTLNENRTSIPEVSAEIQGKKIPVYHEDGTSTSDKTSLNLAWQTLDYLRSTTYGAGLTLDEIDLPAVQECAKIMDDIDNSYEPDWVPYWRYLGWEDYKVENRQILQGSGLLSTSDTVVKNIQALIGQFDASLNIVSGKYTLTMEANRPTIYDIDEGDIINGSIQVADNSMDQKYNAVQASIIDPAKGWGTNTITFFNKNYKLEDNGKDRKANISFPFITNYYTARTRAEYYLRRSRYNRTVSFELPFTFMWLYPNANITLTKKRYNWDKKTFMIQDMTWMANGHIRVVAREYDETMFLSSGQVDNSNNQIPDVVVNVLPPRDLKYAPKAGDPKVGLNGTLSWLPSLSKRVSYYTIKYTGLTDLITIPAPGNVAPSQRMELPLYNLAEGEYTFEVRAVSFDGETSMPVSITEKINPSAILPMIENFIIVNRAVVSGNVFVGKDLQLAWDELIEGRSVDGFKYHLRFISGDTGDTLRDITTTSTTFTYTLAMNKEDYKLLHGTLGIHRNMTVYIRGEGSNNITSINWTVL
ncbi:central tail fiber J [Vibrio phage Thalassa]|uniref:Tail protein n=1 Tax=Vibrio phage Thalassa TaxID=2570301 RepID=A0A2H5BGW9_9CAUD|nr:central tail fiber J [Vibrio phage Thalassa]AUG85236.1 tail protein [Vibrio phage Thalassa]